MKNDDPHLPLFFQSDGCRLVLFIPLIIFHQSFSNPIGQSLTVVRNHQTFLILCILNVSDFKKCSYRSRIAKHIQITFTDCTIKAAVRLVLSVFALKCSLQLTGQYSSLTASGCMIEEHICLVTPRTAVHMNEDGSLYRPLSFR